MDGRIAARLAVDGRINRLVLAIVVVAVPCLAEAADVALSRNFNVLAPDQGLANGVLAQAEIFRREIAKEWLGEDLPTGAGPGEVNADTVFALGLGVGPCIFVIWVTVGLILYRYGLTRSDHARIMSELQARRTSAQVAD